MCARTLAVKLARSCRATDAKWYGPMLTLVRAPPNSDAGLVEQHADVAPRAITAALRLTVDGMFMHFILALRAVPNMIRPIVKNAMLESEVNVWC